MAWFNGWPWANFQEQNLDWFIKKIRTFEGELEELKEFVTNLADTVHNDVAEIMNQWLSDGTIDQIVANAVQYKAWMFSDIYSIPNDITLNVGDTVTTGSAVYMVSNTGIPGGIYYFWPISYRYAQDLGLAADGVTNDRTAFITIMNVLPTIDLKGASVRLNGSPITLQSNRVIKNGSLLWGTSTGTLFNASNISNVLFDNIEFDVSGSPILGVKLSITNSSNISFNNCHIHDWFGTFARLSGSSNLNVTNCRALNSTGDSGNTGACFYMQGGTNANFENLYSYNLTDALIYLDGSVAIRNVTINNIRSEGHTGTYMPHSISVYGDTAVVSITNVTIKECDQGIRVQLRDGLDPEYVTISNVSVIDNNYTGIDITGSGSRHNRVVLSNLAISTKTQDAIDLNTVRGLRIDNAIVSGGRAGIRAINMARCHLSNISAYIEGDSANAGFTLDADCIFNVIAFCHVYNYRSVTVSGFQDLRTETTSLNRYYYCQVTKLGSGSFAGDGFDMRHVVNVFPWTENNLVNKSMFFGSGTDIATIPYLVAGDIAFSRAGGNAGWHYDGAQWVAN